MYRNDLYAKKKAPPAPESNRRALSLATDTVEEDDDKPKERGRPPLDPWKGPMRESSLKRRVELNKLAKEKQRKSDHLSGVRRQAVMSRLDWQAPEVESSEDQQVEDNLPSERTERRNKTEFYQLLPPSLSRQAEMLVRIVQDGLLPELSVVKEQEMLQDTPKDQFLSILQ